MAAQITQEIFKQLLTGGLTFEEYREDLRPLTPAIYIKYEENKIIVKGDFKLIGDIIFRSSEKYEKEIIFDGGIFNNIIFRGGHFKKLFFRRGTYNGFVSIRGGTIGNLVLLGGNFNHWLGALDGLNNSDNDIDKLAEEPLMIERFEIEGGAYTNNIWISGGKIESLEIKCISPVKIHCKPNDDKKYDAVNNEYTYRFNSVPHIRNLIISRYSNKDSFFHISELELDTIKFENYTNLGNITISNIKLNQSISFENSDLGKTTFIDCDFSEQILFFDSSKITDVAFSGVHLPHPSNIKSLAENKSATSTMPIDKIKKIQKRIALGQIKKIYQNMGDAFHAAAYQAEELNTFKNILDRGSEKLTLQLNWFTNRHGQSWFRALKVLIIGSTILYILYCLALGIRFNWSEEGAKNFLKNTGLYFEFLNPLRRPDFLPKVLIHAKNEASVPVLAYVIDYFGRLFTAYLIYQLIAAFRKHGKKTD